MEILLLANAKLFSQQQQQQQTICAWRKFTLQLTSFFD